jgi:Tol biopolymer transport system component
MKGAIILAGMSCLAACNPAKSGNPALPPVTILSPDSANHTNARFSPDGTRLFWWEPSGQTNQLWTADARLQSPTKVPVTAIQVAGMLWSPDRSQIALSSSSSGYVQVAVIPASGGAPKALTNVMFAVPVGWHPDGDRFVYAAFAGDKGGGTIRTFVTSVTRGGSTPLISSESKPMLGVWSPDGSRIAYMVIDAGHTSVWIADSVGQHPRQLATDDFASFGNSETIFSPDGKWIAYESRRTGTSDIWVVPADGGEPRQLTHDIRNDTYPLWSPDSKWIAFLSERGKQTDIWVVPATGGEEIRVTDDAAVEELMQWRDGSTLAFLTGQGQSGIWAMTLADSAERRLTPDSLRTGSPTLSPDGTQVAMLIQRGGGVSDLAVMPVTGGSLRTLVQGGNNSEISWSPDGARIAFTSDRGGTTDIWVVDVAGGEPRQLENWPGGERAPAWSGDGSGIYFMSDRDARLGDIWQVAAAGGEPTRVTRVGTINNVMTRHGRPELFASNLAADGNLALVQVKPGGAVVPIPHGAGGIPIDIIPGTDSVVIAELGKGQGVGFRILPMDGRGEGRALLNPGEGLAGVSDDWNQVVFQVPNGATHDLMMLDRRSGATRRLTNNAVDEGGAVVPPDGKTVLFVRSRSVRRIALADLSKLLAGATH